MPYFTISKGATEDQITQLREDAKQYLIFMNNYRVYSTFESFMEEYYGYSGEQIERRRVPSYTYTYREAWYQQIDNYMRRLQSYSPSRWVDFVMSDVHPKCKCVFVMTPDQRATVHEREHNRFRSGEYWPVPWSEIDKYPDHFVHVSTQDKGMIAYTPDDEKGFLDRQVRMSPGKYLTQYYPHWSQTTIRQYAEKVAGMTFTLQIARSTDEIVRIYKGGPQSCMSHRESDYSSCVHPVSVYGESDLGVAYYGELDHASARCVVWPDRKIYSRIYGSEVLRMLLEKEGYKQGNLSGARIRCIPQGNAYVLPYIDNIGYAQVTGRGKDRMLVLGHGDLDAQRTDGLSGDAEDRDCCDCCGGEYDSEDLTTGTDDYYYCTDCFDALFHRCDDCDTLCRRRNLIADDGDLVCRGCYSYRVRRRESEAEAQSAEQPF